MVAVREVPQSAIRSEPMASSRSFCIAGCFLATALGVFSETVHDLNEGLQSWNRMKREAGYYTESGVYRGGLWRVASNTEAEVYRCLEHTSSHCLDWSMHEENRRKREYGNCTCAQTELPYCHRWQCETTHIDKGADCRSKGDSSVCVDLYLNDTLTCACDSPAPNQRYCSEWSCRDDSSTGYSEEEDYQCLEEDATGEYCYRWKGNISSSLEIESSVCECFERGKHFCEHWECRERSMIRCAAHDGGWCSVEIGVVIGGGLGLFFLLLIGCLIRNPSDNELRENEQCERVVFLCVLVPGGCPIAFLFLNPVHKNFRGQLIRILCMTALLCMPWLVGVVIWGGVLACVIVLPVWICVFVFILLLRYHQRFSKNRQVHPSSQV